LNVELNEGVPAEKHSIIGCLHRAILNQGLTPVWQREASGRRDATFGPLDIVSVTATPIASS
jgi:hypothetical protein